MNPTPLSSKSFNVKDMSQKYSSNRTQDAEGGKHRLEEEKLNNPARKAFGGIGTKDICKKDPSGQTQDARSGKHRLKEDETYKSTFGGSNTEDICKKDPVDQTHDARSGKCRSEEEKIKNPVRKASGGMDTSIAKSREGISKSSQKPEVKKPLLDWVRAEDNSAVRVEFSDDVYSGNIAKALEEIFVAIESYKNVPNVQFQVQIQFAEKSWPLVYSKLQSSSKLLAKIDELGFLESDLSFVHLRDLYSLYCSFKNKDSFPQILVETELAKWRFKGLRDLLPKDEESARSFLKKLRFEKAMTAQEYLNLGPNMVPFDPSLA